MNRSSTAARLFRPVVVLVMAVALFLTGCSAQPQPSAAAPGANGQLTKITVGVIPVIDLAAFRLGVSKGFIKEQGLDVTVQDAQAGNAIVPAVLSGSNQIGFSNLSSILVARDKNMPVTYLAPALQATGERTRDHGAVMVRGDSDITSPKQLAGRTVAVNALKNIAEITTNHVVEADGGDWKAVKYVEMPFADMPGALAGGRIDAAWTVDPFVTMMQSQGAKKLAPVFVDFDPKLQVGGFFTSTNYAQQNPKVVEAFKAALKKSNEYASANEPEIRSFLSTYTKIDPALQQSVVIPKWPTEIDFPSLQKLADEGFKYGFTTKKIDVRDITK